MHEFSIADALAGQVRRHAPAGRRVHEVEVRIGALRGIEPDALRMCWEAVTHDTELAGAALTLDMQPWSIACQTCGSTWTSTVPFVTCRCGETAPVPTAGDELDLISITVADPEGDETAGAGGLATSGQEGAPHG